MTMISREIIACFNPRYEDYMTEAGVINEAFHNMRTRHSIRRAAKAQKRAAKAGGKYAAHAARKLNAEDFHHFQNGNHHLISQKGKKSLAKKAHLQQQFNHHNDIAKQHLDHASDLHSLKMGHGVKQARAHKQAQRDLHDANVSRMMSNHLARRVNSGAHETAKNNFRSGANELNHAASDKLRAGQDRLQKNGLSPHDLHMNHIAQKTSHNNSENARDPHPEDHDVDHHEENHPHNIGHQEDHDEDEND